jgi:hypothetical protein
VDERSLMGDFIGVSFAIGVDTRSGASRISGAASCSGVAISSGAAHSMVSPRPVVVGSLGATTSFVEAESGLSSGGLSDGVVVAVVDVCPVVTDADGSVALGTSAFVDAAVCVAAGRLGSGGGVACFEIFVGSASALVRGTFIVSAGGAGGSASGNMGGGGTTLRRGGSGGGGNALMRSIPAVENSSS